MFAVAFTVAASMDVATISTAPTCLNDLRISRATAPEQQKSSSTMPDPAEMKRMIPWATTEGFSLGPFFLKTLDFGSGFRKEGAAEMRAHARAKRELEVSRKPAPLQLDQGKKSMSWFCGCP